MNNINLSRCDGLVLSPAKCISGFSIGMVIHGVQCQVTCNELSGAVKVFELNSNNPNVKVDKSGIKETSTFLSSKVLKIK